MPHATRDVRPQHHGEGQPQNQPTLHGWFKTALGATPFSWAPFSWAPFSWALAIVFLLTACAAPESEPVIATAPTSPLIALTPTQFNNSVRDVLLLPDNPDDWPAMPSVGVAEPLGAGAGIFGSKGVTPPPWPYLFPPEAGVHGFEGMAKGQVPSSYAVEQLQKAARHFASFVLVSPGFFVCDGTKWAALPAAERDACALSSLLRFAQRAWRRRLTVEEATRLTTLLATFKPMGTAEQALVLAASAILQSPSFLFRIERGDPSRATGLPNDKNSAEVLPLTDWEMASRLSYFLFNSMPDNQLFAAAAKGQLRSRAQIQAQARRMLKDPRVKTTIVRYHHQWLGTTQLHRISPARRAYGPLFGIKPTPPLDTTGDGEWPAIMSPIRRSFELETALFVLEAVFGTTGDNPGTLTALLTGEHGYVSKYSAPVYGVGSCGSVGSPGGKDGGKGNNGKGADCTMDSKAVDLDPAKAISANASFVAAVSTQTSFTLHPATFPPGQRAGVLTLPGVLALGAHPVHPSPILRGKRLLERIACITLSPPPPDAEAAAPKDAPNNTSTNRERTVAATKSAACSGCHDTLGLNAAGFAFEHYDSFGHWRAKDGSKSVDASGGLKLPGEPELTFKNGVELAKKLAQSPRVQNCYVQQHLTYAAGVQIGDDDPTLLALQKTFRGDDRVLELLVAIVGTDLFRHRKVAVATNKGGK